MAEVYSSPPLCPIRPARRVLINNSSFNLILHSHSQCVSHIFNNGAAVNNAPPPPNPMFCGRGGGLGAESMRRGGRGGRGITSQQPRRLTMSRCTRSYHASVFWMTCLFHLHTEHQCETPHCQQPPHRHRSEADEGCSLIKHLFSCH